MKDYIILSDVHCNLKRCQSVCLDNPNAEIIQIGDLGAGFLHASVFNDILPANFRWFRGNHDSPSECPKINGWLGDFGEYNGMFFVGGADSIDKHHRIEGVSWWPDEELSYATCGLVLEAWKRSHCEIILSHDAPQHMRRWFYGIKDSTRTSQLLQAMLEIRKPKVWISGHHHRSVHRKILDISYHSLGIEEIYKLRI